MDLTVQQLRMLREVSSRGTIAAAAEGLGYTPSAVSQQLSSIEKITGVAVLERVGRNVQLTDAGRELVAHADVVLAELERAQAALERVRSHAAGVIRIGLSESMASRILPPLLALCRTDHPELQIRTEEMSSERSGIEAVRSGELDACFTVNSAHAPVRDGVVFFGICKDWFRAVVPADAPFSDPVRLLDLADEPFIAAPMRDSCGQLVRRHCGDAGFEPDVVHEIDDYPATLNVVAAGAGVALVPDLGLARRPEGIRVLDPVKPFYRLVELAYRESSGDRPAIRAILAMLTQVASDLGLDPAE